MTDCVADRKATRGARVVVRGSGLQFVNRVVFTGSGGAVRTTPLKASGDRVTAIVPKGAATGRPFVRSNASISSNRSPRTLAVVSAKLLPKMVFPIRGGYDFGGSGGRFGAGRSGHIHEGQDVMAACGTKLESVVDGRVRYREYQSAAGNYVVIHSLKSHVDLVYMHLRAPAIVRPGQKVSAGQAIGRVGDTGDAQGCHLHFEYWKGVWYGGGHPVDPLPYLKSVKRAEKRRHARV